jgi:ABC-type sugar transport system ATPase subunit
MVGRDINTSHSQSRTIPDSVASEITDLCGQGFQNVSFSIHHGEIFGLAGLVGAGRTEVTRAIFGITPFDKGTVKLNEKTIKCSNPIEAIQLGIALVPEDRRGDGLFLSRPILENTTLVHLKQFASKMGILRRTQERSRVLEILSKMRTAMRNEQLAVGKLSGGNQQKVMLAKWLISAPKLLMLDEPTRGVDIGAKADVHQLIRDVADQGTPILVVSSDLPEILTLCDRIGVMNKGRLVQILSQQEATQEKIMELATQ